MDSGGDTSVYSAKKTYNRLIGNVDYSHTHTCRRTFIQNPIC